MADKSMLPLKNRTFYIDEVDITKVKLRRLERSLSLLGAKLEKFFTKEIYCLVTDHAQNTDYKAKGVSRSATGEGTSVSTPSPFANTPGSNLGTPPDTTSSNSNSKVGSLSRASMMLSKSRQKSSRHGSLSTVTASEQLVRNARQWSIKMISTEDALQWLDKKVVALGLHKKRNSSMERTERAPRSKAKLLKAPYVKIEDESGNYRPIYRQFTMEDTPILNLNALHCPFETGGGARAIADDSSQGGVEKEEPPDPEKAQLDRLKAGNEEINRSKKPPVAKSRNVGKEKATHNNQLNVKKKLTFCMTCKVRYGDLEQHLRSDQHKEFANNDTNYAAVDRLISTNASMHRFLEDILKYHKVHQQEGLAAATAFSTDSEEHGISENEVVVCVTPPPQKVSPDLVHRSVSDGGTGSTQSQDGALEVRPDPLNLKPVLEQRDLAQESEETALKERRVAEPVLNENRRYDATLNNERIIPILDSKPNISRIDIKPKVTSRLSRSPVKTLRLSLEKSSAAPGGSGSNEMPDTIQRLVDHSADADSCYSTNGITLSASEIVKIRKRGKKAATDEKRKSSPVKTSKQKRPPKKKLPNKAPAETKTKQRADILADMQAHWKLLSNRNEMSDEMYGLPMDISYGVLTDNQLENIAQQQTSIGTLDDDDRSLVQSIHSRLANANFNNSAQTDETSDGSGEYNDALLSCDSYITQKLTTQLSQSSNSMLQPTTPRKSPRVSLGARDYSDEHFSPQKRRLSETLQKEERQSAEIQQARRAFRLSFDKSVSEDFSLPTPTENKENREELSDLISISTPITDNHGETNSDGVCILPVIDESVADSVASEKSPPREVLTLPNENNAEMFTHTRPLHASTPAPPRPAVADTKPMSSHSLVSSPTTNPTPNIDNQPEQPGISRPDTLTSQDIHNEKKCRSTARVNPRRRHSSSRRQTVIVRQHSNVSDLSTCFGFEESPANQPTGETNSTTNILMSSLASGSRGQIQSLSLRQSEYDRQTSLLRFGSASASLCDDVFSQPPDALSPFNTRSDANGSYRLDSITESQKEPEPVVPTRRSPRSASRRLSDGTGFGDLSDAVLASPGFKVSSRIRREAADARRILNAGATPKRLESGKLSGTAERSLEVNTRSEMHNGDCKRTHKSPGSTPVKRLRGEGESATELTPPRSATRQKVCPMDAAPDVFTRRPRVARERELRQISERDISTCSPMSSDEEVDTTDDQDFFSACSQQSTRTLPESAREFIRKSKYNYEVNSTGRSPEHPDMRRTTRRQAQTISS